MDKSTGNTADWLWYEQHGFTPIVNVNGTMTGLGSSRTSENVQQAVVQAMGRFVKIHELQEQASSVISELTNSEAGCVTASASAGITLSIAACITGLNPGSAQQLPCSPGSRSEVVVQSGHLCDYGAPVSTAVELTGARIRSIGTSTLTMDHQLEYALSENTAAALYVVSHHVVHYGQIPFARFASICKAQNVPVVVDAASEYDLQRFIREGADIVIYSAHKFLAGPTAGIIAGSQELVRAAYLQNIGIGRGMKVGKESVAGTIVAMQEWLKRDHQAAREAEQKAVQQWASAVEDISGVRARPVADPTGNPIERLQIDIDAHLAGANAAAFAVAFANHNPAIIVRSHEVELGYFQLDPCNLAPGHAEIVAQALTKLLNEGASLKCNEGQLSESRNGSVSGYLTWLDN